MAEHLYPELGLDIVTRSLETDVLKTVAAHVRKCPPCEEQLRAWLAEAEATAALGTPVRGEDGRFRRAGDDAVTGLGSGVRPSLEGGFRRPRRWWAAAGALAAAAALTFVFLPRGGPYRVPEPYWIAPQTEVVVRRSLEGTVDDARFRDALGAYERHDAAAAAELLTLLRASGNAGDLPGPRILLRWGGVHAVVHVPRGVSVDASPDPAASPEAAPPRPGLRTCRWASGAGWGAGPCA